MRLHCSSDSDFPSYAEIMLAHLPIGAALFDVHDLQLLAANPCFYTALDPVYPHEQAIGRHLTEFFPRSQHASCIAIFQSVVTTGVPSQIGSSTAPTHTQGSTYWNWWLYPHCNANGLVTHVLLTATDVTVQVQAQQEAVKSDQVLEAEQRSVSLLATISQHIAGLHQTEDIAAGALNVLINTLKPLAGSIYTADAVQQCFRICAQSVSMDEHFLRHPISLVPYDSAALLNQGCHERRSILSSLPLSGGGDQWAEALLSTMSGAQTLLCTPLWSTSRCEGMLVFVFAEVPQDVAHHMQTVERCVPLLAEALANAALHRDIEQERQHLHTILDQLPDGVLLVEATTGTISYANPVASSLLGIAHADLLGALLNQLEPSISGTEPSDIPWNFALIHALWGKAVISQEVVVRRPDGTRAVLLCSTAPIRPDQSQNITEAVIAFQDITVQKTAEQQKIDFLTMVNHELRTPLTAVLGFSDILREQGMDGLNPLQTKAVTSIVEQSDYLHYLVNEILDQSYLDHATVDLNVTRQDLLPLLQYVVEHSKYASKGHRITLTVEKFSHQDKFMGYFDFHHLAQALNNILSNAIKYSPATSMIEVVMRPFNERHPEEQGVILWVKDQGSGIAAEDLPHIFERFYRAKKRDESVGGLGLGLYLAQKLIRSYGGHIWAESKEGTGTTVFLALPFISPVLSDA